VRLGEGHPAIACRAYPSRLLPSLSVPMAPKKVAVHVRVVANNASEVSRPAASERKFQSHPTVPPGRLIELTFASAVQPGGSRFGTALGNRTPYHPQTESSRGGRSEPTPLGSSVLHEVGQLDPDIERLRAPHPMVMCRVTLRGWCAVNVRQEGKGGQAGKRVLAAELDARWQLEGLVDGPVRVAARGACRWPRPR
jgi:hypothetical protein